MELGCKDVEAWKKALDSYESRLQLLQKPDLLPLDDFYRSKLPLLIKSRLPNPHITKADLTQLMKWKLSRGKWRPRLLGFVSSLEEGEVESVSAKAFGAIPHLSKAVSELTVLKGIGPATASAVLAAYAPDVAPFMSDEAMLAALGNKKDYTLKQYLKLAQKLQEKAKELNMEGASFTASDVERALWSSYVSIKSPPSSKVENSINDGSRTRKRRKPE